MSKVYYNSNLNINYLLKFKVKNKIKLINKLSFQYNKNYIKLLEMLNEADVKAKFVDPGFYK